MLNRIDYLKIFCVVATSSSFKEASIKLGVSPQVVTRCIQELESSLKDTLFYRNTRGIRITEYGKKLYKSSQAILNSIDEVFTPANSDNSTTVRITTPYQFGHRFILPVLERIKNIHPEIVFDIRLSDSNLNVVEEGIDIGIRVSSTGSIDESFVARTVAKFRNIIVCSPKVIEKYGMPEHFQQLNDYPLTALINKNNNKFWPWTFTDHDSFMPENPTFISNDPDIEYEAILSGIGIGQIPHYLAAPKIKEGALIQLFEDYVSEDWYVYLYRPRQGQVPERIRTTFDQIILEFSNEAVFPR